MSTKFETFVMIMAFYILLSYVLFPAGFYYFVEKSYASAGNGFVVGSVLSLGLWFAYGQTLIK